MDKLDRPSGPARLLYLLSLARFKLVVSTPSLQEYLTVNLAAQESLA